LILGKREREKYEGREEGGERERGVYHQIKKGKLK
jgi:hypothetical protein